MILILFLHKENEFDYEKDHVRNVDIEGKVNQVKNNYSKEC